jgi:hypothetical protein
LVQGINKQWLQTLVYNSRCRSCYYQSGEIVAIAQPERENHNGTTSAVCLELLLRDPSVYGFPTSRFAPMGGCLFEKLLKLFFPFANISAKAD